MSGASYGTTLKVGDLVDFFLGVSGWKLGQVDFKQNGALHIRYLEVDSWHSTAFPAGHNHLIPPLTGSVSSNHKQAEAMMAFVVAEQKQQREIEAKSPQQASRDAALIKSINPLQQRITDLEAQLAASKKTIMQQQAQHSAQLAAAHTNSAQLEQRVSLDVSLRESRAQSELISALQSQLQLTELRCKAAESSLQQTADARSAQDQLNAAKATDGLQQRVAQLESELNRSQAQLKEQCESGFQALEQQLSRVLEQLEQTAAASVTQRGAAAEDQRAASSSSVSSAAADTHAASSTSPSAVSANDQQQSQTEAVGAPLAAEVTSDGALTPPSRSVSAHSDRSSDDEWKVVQTD